MSKKWVWTSTFVELDSTKRNSGVARGNGKFLPILVYDRCVSLCLVYAGRCIGSVFFNFYWKIFVFLSDFSKENTAPLYYHWTSWAQAKNKILCKKMICFSPNISLQRVPCSQCFLEIRLIMFFTKGAQLFQSSCANPCPNCYQNLHPKLVENGQTYLINKNSFITCCSCAILYFLSAVATQWNQQISPFMLLQSIVFYLNDHG